jgi:2-C-methyl-D-erythritol 2,4-cyclodiphosphate synthase
VLGGVEIPHPAGPHGHSDADVLLHAIMDALLGAAALGDIGKHFPNSDPRYKDISSLLLLRHVRELLTRHRYEVGNVDSTLVLESPKVSGHIDQMRMNIAEALGIDSDKVSVKATTEEGLGFVGKGEGIAAHAIAQVIQR